MRNRKTVIHRETVDDTDESASTRALVSAKGKSAKKNEVAIRHRSGAEIVTEEAARPGAPVEMLKLSALQEFNDILARIEFPSVTRDNKIARPGGVLTFASFESIHDAIAPILREHGFRLSFPEVPVEGDYVE